MTTFFTSTQAAELAGCSRDSLTRVARKHEIGTLTGRDWIFTTEEARKLAQLVQPRVGAPAGNQNRTGKTKKKRRKRR